ncbi:TetR/AcrR family transcriptional regulator [Corynebacterium sp. H128]|uniref:TetR/AcrR family transcriptional regulator n=1 Tax=unclassified Corynebacterium TaxID=2624378 RepID=UPI0030A1E804
MVRPPRRSQIYEAAIKLFDERGFYGTSMEDIAQAVGIRASSMYNHYPSKQEVLADICVSVTEQLLRDHAAAMAGLTSPTAKVVASMRNHARFHADNAAQVRVGHREIKALQEPHSSIVRQLRRDYVQRWVSIINDGVAAGELHTTESKLSAFLLIDMGTGIANWYRPEEERTLDELCEIYEAIVRRVLQAT